MMEFQEKMLLRFIDQIKQNLEELEKRTYFLKKVRVQVRSSKIKVRCASACEKIIEVRVWVRHTVKILATQHLLLVYTGTPPLRRFLIGRISN